MPRKSDERGFGFRANGLLRILTGADAEQVLIAIEALGFRLPDNAPIESLVELITVLHDETENIIKAFFLDLIEKIDRAIFELEEDPAPGEAEAARALRHLVARREAFRIDLAEKRAMIEAKGKETIEQTAFPFNLPEF